MLAEGMGVEHRMNGKPVYDRLVFYAGDKVFAEGDEGNWAYLVQSGKIECKAEAAKAALEKNEETAATAVEYAKKK